MEIEDPIKTTVEEIRKVLNIENVVGEIIETEDKVLIPVMKMGMAFGAGMGEGESPTGEGGGKGAGAGGAAGIEPIAMIAVFKGISGPEGVKVLFMTAPTGLGKALGEIGTAVGNIMKERTKKQSSPVKTEKKEE